MGRFLVALQNLCCSSVRTSTPNQQSQVVPNGVLPGGEAGEMVVTIQPTSAALLSSHQDARHVYHQNSVSSPLERTVSLVDELPQAAKTQGVIEMQAFPNLIKVGATSAAVLQLVDTKQLFRTDHAEQYLSELDLSAGHQVTARLDATQTSHAKAYLDVRKRAIANFCETAIGQGMKQVIFLGDGLDPLSIDLAARFPNVLIVGMDANFMAEKQQSVDRMNLGNCHYITADITNILPCLIELAKVGYCASAPTLVIGQGLFMYMGTEVCLAWQRQFFGEDTKHLKNEMVFDVHVPMRTFPNEVQREAEVIHANIGQVFEEASGLTMHRDSVYRYLNRGLTCASHSYTWGALEAEILLRSPYSQQYREMDEQPPARMIHLYPEPEDELNKLKDFEL